MDKQMLDLYNQELQYLRDSGREFARAYPKIAGRLGGMDPHQVGADPFVERLLEGFAFLSARVQRKLQAGFPAFTQSLLDAIYPHYLAPTPSMCMVQFEPDFDDTAVARGFKLARGTSLESGLGRNQTRCLYKTAHDVTLWPIRLVEARYLTKDLAALCLPYGTAASAGLRLRFRTMGGLSCAQLDMDQVVLHLAGMGKAVARVYEQCFTRSTALAVRPSQGSPDARTVLKPCPVEAVGFADDESLLPYDVRSFQGYRLLHEFVAFPQRYMFVKLSGLRQALRRCPGNEFDLVVLFDSVDPELERVVTTDMFRLFCTPAVNLFEKPLDRVPVSPTQREHHLVPERSRPRDFEIYRVLRVTGYGANNEPVKAFTSFYRAPDARLSQQPAGHFATRRVRASDSIPAGDRKADASAYEGSEVFLSLADDGRLPFDPAVQQLAVDALCTNRGLPMTMPTDAGRTHFCLAFAAPCVSVRCLGTPTVPKPVPPEDSCAWRLVHHLSHNHLAMAGSSPTHVARSLQDLLRLYGNSEEPEGFSQTGGIQSVECRPTVRSIASAGCVGTARGLTVTVTFDESAFEGASCFLLGAVLERFFARSVSINSFTETVISTTERGEIKRWPKRLGTRQLL